MDHQSRTLISRISIRDLSIADSEPQDRGALNEKRMEERLAGIRALRELILGKYKP